MRYVMLICTEESVEAAQSPEEGSEEMAGYAAFGEEMGKRGVLTGGERLRPTTEATTVQVRDGKTLTFDGPFAETKELVAGFWIWEVNSIEEAVEWAKKCPNPMPGEESDLEIRPYYEAADFGEGFTSEEQAREADLRKRIGDV